MNENEETQIRQFIQSCDFSSKAHKERLWLKLQATLLQNPSDLSDETLADVAAAGLPGKPDAQEAQKKLKDLGKQDQGISAPVGKAVYHTSHFFRRPFMAGFKEFKGKILTDSAFRAKAEGAGCSSPESVVAFGAKEGFVFTVADVTTNTGLTDAELASAAGGKGDVTAIFAATYFVTKK